MKMRKVTILLTSVLLLLSGCSDDDTYTKYSRYRANFTFQYVQSVAPLNTALTSPGMFCTIKLTATQPISLIFSTLTDSYPYPVAASAAYSNYTCVSGFIVGYPTNVEMGTTELANAAFDLACPNCYYDNAIKRDLALQENGIAYCSRCKRSYSLNDFGLIQSGESGRPLERYHISLASTNIMSIYN